MFRTLRTFLAASILTFFLQALRVVFSVLFGIIYDQIFLGPIDSWLLVSNLLVVSSLLAPLLAPSRKLAKWLMVFAVLASAARVTLTLNDAQVRYWGALLTLAFSGLYLTGLLKLDRVMFTSGLIGALAIDQVLRVAGHTFDLSLQPVWLPIQGGWAVITTVLAIWFSRRAREERLAEIGLLDGLALGGFLFLELSLLALPNGVTRWSGAPYAAIAPLLLTLTLLPVIPKVQIWLWRRCQGRLVRVGLSLTLMGGLLIGYFTEGMVVGLLLLVSQGAALAIVISISGRSHQNTKSPAWAVAVGFIFMLVLNFLNAFAFTYPYVLPAMRGLGWAVYMAAAGTLGVGAILPQAREVRHPEPEEDSALIGVASLAAIAISILAVWPQPAAPLANRGTLRAATYNIHYGYDDVWHFNIEEMAKAIEEADIDVIALQEVDTGRITSYSVDDALYLARRLNMNEAYLPTVEHLTGIAVLYRGQQAQIEWRLLTSLQEQTGIIHVRLKLQGRDVDAFGTWLGLSNEDTDRQIQEALMFIGDRTPAIFGGDFNAQPGSPVVQAIEEAGFHDPFVTLNVKPEPLTSPAVNPQSRIDYVWLRGLLPLRAWVSESLASDHRLVVVEVGLIR